MLAPCWPNYVGPMLAHLGACIEAMLVICETISVERPPRCQFFLPEPFADPNRQLATAKQHEAGIGPAECQCRASLSEACGKQALEPCCQRPNIWPATTKQHAPAVSKGPGLQHANAGRHFLKPLEKKLWRHAASVQTAGPSQQNSMKLPVSKGVGLQDANAGRHFLKPLEKKLWSHAASIQKAGSPQQHSMELLVSKRVSACRMPMLDVTF